MANTQGPYLDERYACITKRHEAQWVLLPPKDRTIYVALFYSLREDSPMRISHAEDDRTLTGYSTKYKRLPAFDLTGFTKIVESGGELYDKARGDGRWEVLRNIAGDDKTIYGVASFDKECTKGHYRYTLAVKASEDQVRNANLGDSLFSIHIKESEWIVFTIDSFAAQWGKFWQDNPYNLIKKLGWDFNLVVGLHIDVFPPSYSSNDDCMEFMMPVRRSADR